MSPSLPELIPPPGGGSHNLVAANPFEDSYAPPPSQGLYGPGYGPRYAMHQKRMMSGPMGPMGGPMGGQMGPGMPQGPGMMGPGMGPGSMNSGPMGPGGNMGPGGPSPMGPGMMGPGMSPGMSGPGGMPPNSMGPVNNMGPGMGPGGMPVSNHGGGPPMSHPGMATGKVYPHNQPMVFNPSNPNAPPIYPCGICHKEVHDNDQAILCESGCNFWFHRGCTGLTDPAYQMLTQEVYAEWVCDACLSTKTIPLIKMKP